MSHGQSSPFWDQDSAPYISTCLRFPAFVWLLLFSLSRTGPGGPHGQGPPFWERARAKSLPGHNTPSRHPRPCTLVHYSILPPESAFSEEPGICKYAVWTTSQSGGGESLLRSPGAAWLLAAVPRVANPARTKEEAPLGSLELGEICPNCIFGDVSAVMLRTDKQIQSQLDSS